MYFVIILMAIFFLIGMFAWLTIFRKYYSLINDVRRGNYKKPLIKQIVLKYDNCKKLEITINNVNAFVEKLIANYKVMGLRFTAWRRLAKCLEYFIIMIGIITSFIMRDSTDAIYICIGITALCTIALILMERMTDMESVHRTLIAETVDYLENTGAHRNLIKEQYSGKLTKEAANEFDKLNKSYEKIEAATQASSVNKKAQDAEVLNDVINEFLT
jgi:hypothetical protein